jgi:Gamma-glutamyl cyclotransferase, AIG2-like
MAYLFSFSTLQDPAVQMSTFGRLLKGEPDELFCYEQDMLTVAKSQPGATGQARYAVVRFTGRSDTSVRGTVFEVGDAELALADRNEPTEYGRIIVTLASGKEAWVYADARTAEPRR